MLRPRTLRRATLAAALLIHLPSVAWSWETAHGRPDNTSFVDVPTAPATTPRMVGNIGSIAPGAGPVVAADGTVYIGNQQGKLMSFKPDGTPGWSRDLNRGEAILASPAIGSDGSIYVIGVRSYTDHRVEPSVKRADGTLHRFTSSGGWLSQIPFPEHNGGGGTTASPNLWRFDGVELVIVPAPYRLDIRLLAFSPNGGLVADQRATSIVPEITGGAGLPKKTVPFCLLPPLGPFICYGLRDINFKPPQTALMPPPFPGVGLHTNPLGGTPWILLSDHFKDLVGFTFSLADYKFHQVFRVHEENRYMRSAPSFMPDQHGIIGTEDIRRDDDGTESGALKGGVVFSGPSQTKAGPIAGLQRIYAPATRLRDGRTALIGADGELVLLNGGQVTARVRLPGTSIAAAAASRTHLFVSTDRAFQTFDPNSLTEVARVEWSGGGKSPPVIGPQGQVYAITNNTLFVFGRPTKLPGSDATVPSGPVGGGVFQDSGIPAPQPQAQSQNYKPPLTTSGNRLFACEKLDGDDCGKGDYRAIALAFCEKQGFTHADDIDVDSRKVKAETLNGEYCTKKKCKVFDEIVCNK